MIFRALVRESQPFFMMNSDIVAPNVIGINVANVKAENNVPIYAELK